MCNACSLVVRSIQVSCRFLPTKFALVCDLVSRTFQVHVLRYACLLPTEAVGGSSCLPKPVEVRSRKGVLMKFNLVSWIFSSAHINFDLTCRMIYKWRSIRRNDKNCQICTKLAITAFF